MVVRHLRFFLALPSLSSEPCSSGTTFGRFDLPFLAAHFSRLGLPRPENTLLDTLELTRAHLALPNYKLGTVAAYFAIPTDGAHRAAADVAITREVFLKLIERVA